jgi:hypothetical protein
MIRRVWRRCPDCGHLRLVPFGQDDPCPCRRAADDAPRSLLDWLAPRLARRPERVDDVALRLLERAFPDGLDV